jgi:signal peptidase I
MNSRGANLIKMKEKTFFFSGTSMFPFLRPGDRIYVQETPWHQLHIGDLVVVASGNSSASIVHRLVGWKGEKANRLGILKGDSLLDTDNFVLSQQNYLGRVWARERNGKRLLLDGFRERIWARLIVFFSVLNLTPGVVRLKVARELKRILPRITGIKKIECLVLKKSRYFFFSGPEQDHRLLSIYRGKTIGEIIFHKDRSRTAKSPAFSVYSPLVSAEKLSEHAMEKFPEVFETLAGRSLLPNPDSGPVECEANPSGVSFKF